MQVWRREKSLPNFYDKPVVKEDAGAETSRPSRNAPPPSIVRYIRELSEQRKTVDTRQSADSTQRYRSKLHPKADFSFEGWSVTEHQQDLIPSFIPRQERTKTTLGDEGGSGAAAAAAAATTATTTAAAATGGGSNGAGGGVTDRSGGHAASSGLLGREVSNLMSAYTRDKPLQQQQVCLKGGKLSMTSLGRHPLLYLKPFSAYRHRQTYHHVSAVRAENSPSNFTPRQAVSLSLSPRGSGSGGAIGMVTSSANGQHLHRRDLVLSGSSFHTPDKAPPLQPLRVSQSSPHRFNSKLGAAQDSLLMLSRTGAPTVLERNLSFDQEVRLERCRRERSFAAVCDSNILSTAHYVSYDSQPTRGEVTLMKAREANKSRDGSKAVYRRNGLQKPFGSVPPFAHSHAHFMTSRALDHSPRSTKSELGDSGIMSSPGDNSEEAARAGDLALAVGLYPRDLGDEPIPEHPGDCEEEEEEGRAEGEALQTAALQMWAQADSVALLDPADAGSDFVESTDEYRRPLSDSAANEAVHVRNELTPLSAENKARMLPREESYVEAMEAEGGRLSHRQRREGFVREAAPPQGRSAQEPTQTDSGAETASKDADASKSHNAEVPGTPAAVPTEWPGDEIPQDKESEPSDPAADADTSEMDSQSTATAPGAPAYGAVAAAGDRSATVEEAGSGRKGTSGGQARTGGDLELVSVNSSAPSCVDPESARDAAVQRATAARATRTEDLAARGARAAGPESKPGEATCSATDRTPRPTAGDEDNRPAQTAENRAAEQDGSPAGRVPEEEAGLSVGDTEAEQGLAARDVQTGVLDNERNVSKTSARGEGHAVEKSGPAGPDGRPGDPAPAEHSAATARKDGSGQDDSVGEDGVQPPHVQPEDGSGAAVADSAEREEGPESGVEAIVTVTMETVQTGDNFDGSKTFLTTSNVEPEDWQNMVKV